MVKGSKKETLKGNLKLVKECKKFLKESKRILKRSKKKAEGKVTPQGHRNPVK